MGSETENYAFHFYFTFELSPIIEAALNFCHENQNIPLIYKIGYKNITQLHINA